MYGGVPSDDVHAFGRASGMYIHLELLSTILNMILACKFS